MIKMSNVINITDEYATSNIDGRSETHFLQYMEDEDGLAQLTVDLSFSYDSKDQKFRRAAIKLLRDHAEKLMAFANYIEEVKR